MLALTGYAERLSVRPGETLRFHVSHAHPAPVRAWVVRVVCADPNPAIGGVQCIPVDMPVKTLVEPQPQRVPSGSYAVLGDEQLLDPFRATGSISLRLWAQPTLLLGRRQVLLSWQNDQGQGLTIELTAQARVCIRLGSAAGETRLESANPLSLRVWSCIRVGIDSDARTLRLSIAEGPAQTMLLPADAAILSGRRLSLASASDQAPVDVFNGRLEGLSIWASPWPESKPDRVVASWDFSRQVHTQAVIDTSPRGQHGLLVNTPTRAVRGVRWTGEEHCFRHAPSHYAAIHFHEDDLDDCRWPATHEIVIPDHLRSDAYALMLEAGDARENIPFFVVPRAGQARSRIAVLVSTFTYTVYGNHARPEWMHDARWREAHIAQTRDWQAYPHNPGEHRDYGLSTYNVHTDGSGIGLVSWRRPMLNLRLGYLTYPYPDIRGSGLRHYPADSHLLMWMAHQGHEFDLITDAELHAEGEALLSSYKVVVTGSHPEYHTAQMLDALQGYRDKGGRLVYLGGNGFYWRVALDPTREGIIEVRRAEGGIRAWAAEPGEYYQQFDGQYGGLWRRNARPPQQLVGVGFSAQGNFVGSHYRIHEAARTNPKVSWILDGVNAETIGGEGYSGHGAAGFELDRMDVRLGSPPNAVVIATSENHPPEAPWVLVPEEQLTHITTLPGESHQALIRADMTYFDLPGGGEVFSVGSITFCGALPVNGFDNDISRLLDNVIRRFSRP
ncbi:MAG: N,N-dimethylformamidase beta subunit family domain-containing protein [Burkholderiaceae bacterium]